MSHKKFGPDGFSRFDVYWIQTDKQTDKPNLYIDKVSQGYYSNHREVSQVTILRKIRGNSQEYFLGIRGNSQDSFTGKSGENVDSFSQEFLVTHSEEPGPRNFL